MFCLTQEFLPRCHIYLDKPWTAKSCRESNKAYWGKTDGWGRLLKIHGTLLLNTKNSSNSNKKQKTKDHTFCTLYYHQSSESYTLSYSLLPVVGVVSSRRALLPRDHSLKLKIESEVCSLLHQSIV